MAIVHKVFSITGTATGSSGELSGQAKRIYVESGVNGYFTLTTSTSPGAGTGFPLTTGIVEYDLDYANKGNLYHVSGSTSTGYLYITEII